MKWAIGLVLCASVAIGQSAPDAIRARYRQQGTDALKKEQDRSKANLCAEPKEAVENSRIAQCLIEQNAVTEQDYISYIRAIGALLRSPGSESAHSPPKSLSFDSAEQAWQTYRERGCASVATQWKDGDLASVATSNCRLRITWNHLDELANLYSDLWNSLATHQGQPEGSALEGLRTAVGEVKAQSRLAVLVPSELPQPVANAKHAMVESASDDDYAISLYYDLGVGIPGSLHRLRPMLAPIMGRRTSQT